MRGSLGTCSLGAQGNERLTGAAASKKKERRQIFIQIGVTGFSELPGSKTPAPVATAHEND